MISMFSTCVAGLTAALFAMGAFGLQTQPPEKPASDAAAPPEAAETPEEVAKVRAAVDWMLATRVARDGLSAEQAKSLQKRYDQLTPVQARVMVMVFEQSYGVKAPEAIADYKANDATNAAREWLVAFRIVNDHLTVDQAKDFGKLVLGLSESQVWALVEAYREKSRNRPEPTRMGSPQSSQPDATPQHEVDAQQTMRAAQDRMAFEQQRRQMDLDRAAGVRANTAHAQNSANQAAWSQAASVTQRLQEQQAMTNEMILRRTPVSVNYGYSGYSGWGY